ncbi:hypothetical protein CDD83_872 [Cordyceps sp. RAO-2017]|nr:hypothetical protein CDD83_872 [Cordyceps sp. RAO-2017]
MEAAGADTPRTSAPTIPLPLPACYTTGRETSAMAVEPDSVPDFDDLPPVEGMPQGCTWGVFDRDGKKDLVGTLNFLTPAVVRAAAAEIKDGVSISLK